MKTLLLQTDIFQEEENSGYIETISKHFKIVYLKNDDICKKIEFDSRYFRASLQWSKKFKHNIEFTNCIKWVPFFRAYLVDAKSYFNDIGYFVKYAKFPMFLRPVAGDKTFAGQVFTHDKLIQEFNYLKNNLNYDESLMCMGAEVKKITKEWRTVFVNDEYIDGSLYMKGGDQVEIEKYVPVEVINLAKLIAKHDYFINKFNYVIDICECDGNLCLMEINSFESSSFYGADLEEIYKAYSKT